MKQVSSALAAALAESTCEDEARSSEHREVPPYELALKFAADDQVTTVIKECVGLLSELDRDVARNLVESFFGGPDGLQQAVTVETDVSPAVGAGNVIVRLKPTDRFIEFVAALRAPEPDGRIVKN